MKDKTRYYIMEYPRDPNDPNKVIPTRRYVYTRPDTGTLQGILLIIAGWIIATATGSMIASDPTNSAILAFVASIPGIVIATWGVNRYFRFRGGPWRIDRGGNNR